MNKYFPLRLHLIQKDVLFAIDYFILENKFNSINHTNTWNLKRRMWKKKLEFGKKKTEK